MTSSLAPAAVPARRTARAIPARLLGSLAVAGPAAAVVLTAAQDVLARDFLSSVAEDPLRTSPLCANAFAPYAWMHAVAWIAFGAGVLALVLGLRGTVASRRWRGLSTVAGSALALGLALSASPGECTGPYAAKLSSSPVFAIPSVAGFLLVFFAIPVLFPAVWRWARRDPAATGTARHAAVLTFAWLPLYAGACVVANSTPQRFSAFYLYLLLVPVAFTVAGGLRVRRLAALPRPHNA